MTSGLNLLLRMIGMQIILLTYFSLIFCLTTFRQRIALNKILENSEQYISLYVPVSVFCYHIYSHEKRGVV